MKYTHPLSFNFRIISINEYEFQLEGNKSQLNPKQFSYETAELAPSSLLPQHFEATEPDIIKRVLLRERRRNLIDAKFPVSCPRKRVPVLIATSSAVSLSRSCISTEFPRLLYTSVCAFPPRWHPRLAVISCKSVEPRHYIFSKR